MNYKYVCKECGTTLVQHYIGVWSICLVDGVVCEHITEEAPKKHVPPSWNSSTNKFEYPPEEERKERKNLKIDNALVDSLLSKGLYEVKGISVTDMFKKLL